MRLLDYRQQRQDKGERNTFQEQNIRFQKFITRMTEDSKGLNEDILQLNYIAGSTKNAVKTVRSSIDEINDGNQELIKSISRIREASAQIRQGVEDNVEHVEELLATAKEMTESNDQVKQIFEELMEDNRRTSQVVQDVAENTKISNEATKEILEAAEMIHVLTYKTNLLGLNASIEAARAGEAGRGFAVVAKQIQELARKSKESAENIEKILEKIRGQSELSIQNIDNMQSTFERQTTNLEITKLLLSKTGEKIDEVYERVEQVEINMNQLGNAQNTIISNMDGLVKVGENNQQATEMIVADFQEIVDDTAQIAGIAYSLSAITDDFRYSTQYMIEGKEQKICRPLHLRVGYMPNYGSLCSIVAAMKLGYLEQEGITVELIEFENGGLIIDALRQGRLEVGYIGHGAHKRCMGGEAVIFLLSHISNAEAVIGNRKQGIKSLKALKGRRVGTVEGTTSDTILNFALNSVGYTRRDCEIISKKPEQLVKDMVENRLDACAIWSPWTLEVQKKLGSDGILLANNMNFASRLASLSSWITTPDYARSHQEVLLRLTRALYRGMNYRVIEANVRQVAAWVSEITQIDEQSAYEQRGDAEWATSGYVSIGAKKGKLKQLYEAQQKQFLKDGDIAVSVPVENYVLFQNMIEAAK